MKKLIITITCALLVATLFTGCLFEKTAKGKNAKIYNTRDDGVSFYPVCPKCDHVSPKGYVNVSDGEYEEGTYICEECSAIYEILIDRR